MRKKLSVLLLVLIILMQAFAPVTFAASKNEAQSQTAYFCPSDATSKGMNKGRNVVGTNFSDIKPTQTVVNRAKVDEYVQKLKAGEKVDPIVVYEVPGKGKFIEEGHHRFIASQETGIPVEVVVKQGSGPTGLPDWSEVEWKSYINENQFWGD